jgi:hypothetical protein
LHAQPDSEGANLAKKGVVVITNDSYVGYKSRAKRTDLMFAHETQTSPALLQCSDGLSAASKSDSLVASG